MVLIIEIYITEMSEQRLLEEKQKDEAKGRLRVTFGADNNAILQSEQQQERKVKPINYFKDAGYLQKSAKRVQSESSVRESDVSETSNFRSEQQTPTENYLQPIIMGAQRIDTQVFAQEFDVNPTPPLTQKENQTSKKSIINAKKKTVVSFNQRTDLDSEVAAITGNRKIDQAISIQEDLSSRQLNVDATIASLGIQQDSKQSLMSPRSPKAKHFVSNSSFSQALSPHGSGDFSLPSIDRRAVSILETTANKEQISQFAKKAQSQLKTRQEIEAKIKDKRNSEALQSVQNQLQISKILFNPTKPFRGGKIMEHFLAQPNLLSEKSIGNAFYEEIAQHTDRDGLYRRSQSVQPDQKMMVNVDSDLRQAFQQFQKGSNPYKRSNPAGNSYQTMDRETSRPPSRFFKDNLIINNGSEVAIQALDDDKSHVEDNKDKSKAQFIEAALVDFINKDRLDKRYEAAHTHKLNYQSKPLGLIMNNQDLAERNLSTLNRTQQVPGVDNSRFAKDLNSKGGSIPPQILEEWINQTLMGDDDEEMNNATKNLPRKFKTKNTKKLTQLMQIDYSSLCRNGMPSDKASQLLRSLYVHSVGYFQHIEELLYHCKGKKDIIMNVWRVFYMLLESCQKVEHKMIMIELAESFEVEKAEFKSQLKQQQKESDQKVKVLKNEIAEQVNQILNLQDQLIRGEDEYLRLNTTYQILASQNEEALTLRLRTEARLKDLFSRDRLRDQEMAMVRKQKEESDQLMEAMQKNLAEKTEIFEKQEEELREKTAQIKLLTSENAIIQKQNRIYKGTIAQQLLPRKKLQKEVTIQTTRADYIEARHEDLERQVDMISRQRDDAMSEVQILRNLTNNQRQQVYDFEEQSKQAFSQMQEMQQELDKRIGLITNIDQTLQEKDEKIVKFKKQVEHWRQERYEFAAETESTKDRLAQALKTIETLKRDLSTQDEAVQQLYQTIWQREETIKQELERNLELQKLYEEKDAQIVLLSTTTFAQMEREVNRSALEVAKLKNEILLKEGDRETEKKLLKDQIEDVRKQEKLLEEMMKKKRSENILLESNLSEVNNALMRTQSKNVELEALIKALQKKASMGDAKLTRQINETDCKNIEVLNTQGQLNELQLQKEVLEKQLEVTIASKDFVIEDLRNTIKIFDTRDLTVYEANMMMGEDHRSQALENFYTILSLQQKISQLNQILVDKDNDFKKERTQHRRQVENLGLEICEWQSDLIDAKKTLQQYKSMIDLIKNENLELLLTIKKLKQIIGDTDLEFVGKSTQTIIVTRQADCQTKKVKTTNIGLQMGQKIITSDAEIQTDDWSPAHSQYKIDTTSPQETLPKHKVKVTTKKPNHKDDSPSPGKMQHMNIIVNDSEHRQNSSSEKSISVNKNRPMKRGKKNKGNDDYHPKLLGKSQFADEKKSKKNSPDKHTQKQVEVRINKKHEVFTKKMEKSVYTEMQETKRLETHHSKDLSVVLSQPEIQRQQSPPVEYLHVEKTVILSKKASYIPSMSNVSPDLNRTNASHFSLGQHLGRTNEAMRHELSAYERAMIKDLQNPIITRNESLAQTLLDSQESARQILIQESMHKDGFPNTKNKYFIRDRDPSSRGTKKQFIPFKPSEEDLVGPNKLVYEYRMQLKNYKRGGLSQSPSNFNIHGRSSSQLNLNTIDLNENVIFQEKLESHRQKVKSHIRIAAMKDKIQ